MLQAIRDRATGWIAYGIIGFLIIPFAFWGIDQYGGGGTTTIAVVGGEEISQQEFQRAYLSQQSRMQDMLGGNLDLEALESMGLKRQVLDQLINQRVLTSTSSNAGMRIGDEMLARTIHDIGAFQTEGSFDLNRYRQLIASQGYTPESFEAQMRLDVQNQQLQAGVGATFEPTVSDLDLVLKVREQRREIETLRLSLAAAREGVQVDDDELATWFENHRDQFQVPERARVQYLELNADTLGDEIPVSEDELRARYDEESGRFVRPEERVASYALLPLDPSAVEAAVEAARQRMQDLRGKLESGELALDQLPQQSAQGQPDIEVGELGVVVDGMLDPAGQQALAALNKAGQVTEVVRNDFGFQILRLDELRPAQARPFEEVKDELAAAIRRERGENRFYELADEMATLTYENPGSLDEAADTLGLEVQQSDWVTRTSEQGIWSEPNLRSAVFSPDVLDEGLNSQPVELTATHVVVLRLLEHETPRPQELNEVREAALAALRDERAQAALAEQAQQVVAAVREGRSLETEAERTGGTWEAIREISRSQPGLDTVLRETVFELPHPSEGEPSVADVQVAGGDRTVAVLHSVEPGDPTALPAAQRDALRAALAEEYGQHELAAVLAALRQRTDVEIFEDRL